MYKTAFLLGWTFSYSLFLTHLSTTTNRSDVFEPISFPVPHQLSADTAEERKEDSTDLEDADRNQ